MVLFPKRDMKLLTPSDFKGKTIIGVETGMVMVGAEWCGYCRMLKPTWKQFKKFAGKEFLVMAVDAVKYPDLVKKLGVKGYPTIFSVKNGKMIQYTDGRTLFDLVSNMCELNSKHKKC